MAIARKNPKARRGMTVTSAPNFFTFSSERARLVVETPASKRSLGIPAVGPVGDIKPAGSKLVKRFNRSGMRAMHAKAKQLPCYGRRSERHA